MPLLIEIIDGISIEGALPDAVLETVYSAQLRARNAVLPLRWEKVGGAWPPTGDWSIDEVTGIVSGDADDAGPYSVTIMCTDGAGNFAQRTFKWRVAAAPLVLAGDMPDAQVGDSASYTYTISGGRGVKTVTVVAGALPPGRTISSAGVVTGTYSAGGSYAWTLRVVDEDLAEAFLSDASVVAYAALAVGGAWTGVVMGQPLGGSPRAITGGLAPYAIGSLPISGTRPPGVTISVSGSTLVASGNTTTAGTYAWTDRLTSTDGQHVDIATTLDITYVPQIYLGGLFDTISAVAHSGLARYALDGTHDAAYTPSITSAVNHQVFGIASLSDARKIVVGSFSGANGSARGNIAVFMADGSIDASFATSSTAQTVNAVAIQPDGKIVLVGAFGVIRLSDGGVVDPTFTSASSAGAAVSAVAIQADGKIVIGGAFGTINGVTRQRLARLNADGTLDMSYDPGASSSVSALTILPGDKLLVGGNFATISGVTYGRLARLNADGTADLAFANIAISSGVVSSIVVLGDGKIVIGGSFTAVSGTTRQRLARLSADGALDTGWACNANGTVSAIGLHPSGALVVGGAYMTIGGQPRNRIALINADASVAGWNPMADAAVQSVLVG